MTAKISKYIEQNQYQQHQIAYYTKKFEELRMDQARYQGVKEQER